MLLLLMILLLIKNDNCQNEETNRRIYHGFPDTDNRFPYVVCIEQQMDYNYVRLCSGIVIDENWILTAGHCVRENMTLTVTYRNRIRSNSVARVNILLNIRHPNYHFLNSSSNNWTTFYDIGLIKVEKINVETFAELSSNNYKKYSGLSVVFAGYGNTWNKSEATTSAEWKEKKQMLNNSPLLIGEGIVSKCGINISDKICLCVRTTVTSTRKGDSGGPLVHDGTVIGIHIGKLNEDMAFVPISRHLSWIREQKSKHSTSSQNFDSKFKFKLSLKIS